MGSIKWKMATLYMILVVTVMIGCGAFILFNLRSNAYEDLFKELEYTAERIVDVLSTEDLRKDQEPEEIFGEILTAIMMESINVDPTEVDSTGVGGKSIYLLDEKGQLRYTRAETLSAADLASRAIMDARTGQKMDSLYIHTVSEGQERVGDYAMSFELPQNGKTYIIFIRQSMQSVQQSLRSATYTIFICTVFGIVVAGILGYFLAVNISGPILRLTRKTQQLASGNLEEAALMESQEQVESKDELVQLETHFDHMAHELSGMILELQQMEQMQKEFVANVSHELRTPITTVKSYVETILDNEIDDPQLLKRFLSVASQESDRMAALIADLLELSKMDSHQVQLVREPVEMGQLVRDNLQRSEWEARAKHQQLRWAADMGPLPMAEDGSGFPAPPGEFWVRGEARKIEQVLRNLLTNAMKYSPEGAVIEAGVYAEADEIRVKVQDNGMGISPQDQKYIFERFYRVDKARSRSMGGTGLGLSIAREIMELHQGKIWVQSELGKGSCFWLSFPKELRDEE